MHVLAWNIDHGIRPKKQLNPIVPSQHRGSTPCFNVYQNLSQGDSEILIRCAKKYHLIKSCELDGYYEPKKQKVLALVFLVSIVEAVVINRCEAETEHFASKFIPHRRYYNSC